MFQVNPLSELDAIILIQVSYKTADIDHSRILSLQLLYRHISTGLNRFINRMKALAANSKPIFLLMLFVWLV